mgnify:CR=1 FL=1
MQQKQRSPNKNRERISTAISTLSDEYGPIPPEPRRLEPCHELVFTILSQHTSDTNSERAFTNLMKTFKTLENVANAPVTEIETAISRGGLAKIKAPRIKSVLTMILDLNQNSLDLSFLREMPLEHAKSWLKQLPGIGPKSAGIVLSFSLGMPAMAIDTHIYRVSQRLGFIKREVSADKAHDILEAIVDPDDVYPFHFTLITHGRQVCKAQNPLCEICALSAQCPSIKSMKNPKTRKRKTTPKQKPIVVPHTYPTEEVPN